MSFTKSTVGVTNISDLPDQPTISAAALKAKLDQYGADDKPYVNGLIDELEDAANGTSGSDSLGMTQLANNGSATETAQAQAEALDVAVGDRTYTEQNYITDSETIVASLDALDQQAKAENDASVKITGNQTVAGIKTFTSVVKGVTPIADEDLTTKEYVLGQSPLTIPNDSITNQKMSTDVKIGSLAALDTTIKTDVVSAINEVAGLVAGTWDDYVPTLTFTGTPPDGINTQARYNEIGNTVNFNIRLKSSDGNGATALSISLPKTPKDNNSVVILTAQEKVDTTWTNPFPFIDDDSGAGIQFRNFGTATDAVAWEINVTGSYEV